MRVDARALVPPVLDREKGLEWDKLAHLLDDRFDLPGELARGGEAEGLMGGVSGTMSRGEAGLRRLACGLATL